LASDAALLAASSRGCCHPGARRGFAGRRRQLAQRRV